MPKTNMAEGDALLNTLTELHAMASTSFDRIKGVAKCALRSLETERGQRDMEAIAQAFEAIIVDADINSNEINCECEKAGIETVNPAWSRRSQAARLAAEARSK